MRLYKHGCDQSDLAELHTWWPYVKMMSKGYALYGIWFLFLDWSKSL